MTDTIKLEGTHIVIIEDKSGSMASMGNIPMEKVNNFIKEQTGDNVLVDVWTFNQTHYMICEDKKPSDVNITMDDVKPSGGTALYQSIGNIIDITGKKLSLKTDIRPAHVIFVIFTDGDENESRGEYKGESGRIKVKKMIEHQQDVYNWTFFFLGSNIDAINTGEGIGISRQTCINYSSNSKGYDNVFKSASQAVTRLRSVNPNDRSEAINMSRFSDMERTECVEINPPVQSVPVQSSRPMRSMSVAQ